MRSLTARAFWTILPLIALIGLVLRVEVGRKTFISFDEWQHLFMASCARWADLSFELRTNAHPPLLFLILKYVVRLGNTALYRSISIASGVGSIIVVGLIARKILDSQVLQLLCAVTFAFSVDAISISDEIRSYQLAVLLVLFAFWAWLRLLENTKERFDVPSTIAFGVSTSLALLTHYSVVFTLGACVIVSLLFAKNSGARIAWALLPPCVVFAVEYAVHAGAQPMQGYLFDFYLSGTAGESAVSFLIRNFRNFFNLFSPIALHNSVASVFFILLLSGGVMLAFRQRSHRLRAAPMIFAIVLVLELVAASLVDKYPFGGLLRHQYIAGPFLIIAGFVALDALIPLVRPSFQLVIPVLVLLASIVNLAIEGPKLILYPGVVLLQKEFNVWRSAFPQAQAVYVDHWGVIGYFIHTSTQPRTFVRRISDNAVIDEYRAANTEIFYDKSRDVLNFYDSSVYRSFADCIRQSGVDELTLFFYSPGNAPIDHPDQLERTILERSAAQGLVVTKIVIGRTSLAAGFRLRDFGPR